MTKEEKLRREGADWAFRMMKQKGVEAAEREFIQRGLLHAPLNLSINDITECNEYMYFQLQRKICCLTLMTLHDEFDFGKQRLERFEARFNNKLSCMNDGLFILKDYAQMLKDETGVDIDVEQEYKPKTKES